MILDILQTILNISQSTKDKINLTQIIKHCHENMFIYTMYDNEHVTQFALEKRKFNRLKILNCNGNIYVNNVNHLAETLEELDCGCNMSEQEYSSIGQRGISKLKKLVKLECCNNYKIENVNHLSNTLEYLDCSFDYMDKRISCNIGDSGISQLRKLRILKCCNNTKIRNIQNMDDTLEELYCGNSYINQKSIQKLKNLNVLNCNNCELIKDVNHLSDTLKILHCGGDCGIYDLDISRFGILERIYREYNHTLDQIFIPSNIVEVKNSQTIAI